MFFSKDENETARAKEICRGCARREPCLAGAIARKEPDGVWGGMLIHDGVPIVVRPKRGRPRKQKILTFIASEHPATAASTT